MYDALLEDFEDDVTRTSEDEENFQKPLVEEIDEEVDELREILAGSRQVTNLSYRNGRPVAKERG